ncbi:MAG: polyketide synthase, partial [Planctomycetales bacterium]|nr:polyketide synthase [Planctomycetales bacterium]
MDDFLNRIEDLSPQQLRLLADRLRRRLEQQHEERHAAIAVVGMACRFPDASSPQEFWALLREGRDVVRQVPADRWSLDDFYDGDRTAPGKMYCGHGAFLEHVDQFDPSFFNISPREAENMDPQQRLLLEVGWEAIENTGWATEIHGSNTGVFVGIGPSSYTGGMSVGRPTQINAYTGAGNLSSTAAGRISHVFGLRGPSLAVDTACSSSLVAVHLAVQSLRNRESDAALVAGVNLALAPEVTVYFCKVGVLSSSGKCRSFDAAADGYVRGEGCGVVILRRLADALSAGDP